jgi:hypothetical protein
MHRRMSSESSRAAKHSLKGVGGWLAFFCFMLLVVYPLLTLILWGQNQAKIEYRRKNPPVPAQTSDPALNQWFDSPAAQIHKPVVGSACHIAIALAAFGVIAGVMLLARTKGAVMVTKLYLLCVPLASLSQLLFVRAELSEDLKRVMTPIMVQDVIKSALYGAIWFAYFCQSRRVKNTYGIESPQSQGG